MFGRATIRLGISPHSSANLECRSERCCTWLAENAGRKKVAKNRDATFTQTHIVFHTKFGDAALELDR